jgi:hypothetical protein
LNDDDVERVAAWCAGRSIRFEATMPSHAPFSERVFADGVWSEHTTR